MKTKTKTKTKKTVKKAVRTAVKNATLQSQYEADAPTALVLVPKPALDETSLALMTNTQSIAAQVSLLRIIDPQSNQRAVDMLQQLKQMRDKIEERRVEIIRPLQEGVKRVQAL